ncbi:D-amino acid dehydrogenase small subunit [Bordetella trematum]|uniref:D-amino acid dehydrogenase small subunit n=1 Tax=Bordetella trematum TaxID=123899 RepID=A0A157SSC4_9BORD|nr:D-amino acid dehydrogenase [Bordetella trematum]AUL47478.1 D-amino acid dehydrogenase small subunit [Bordetella trematum]AZR94340.1 D-amino acid dehydrogenase small subunit [Bordetella trematum]NNH19875.1 D-amino acid dehydrogenase [Bordetella trematum]QIM72883.1 D-amino acid dehydrogenase [Bordetella trematum]SAI52842.1 D-amino acid dehydrogenase small subunit [Bordetella trematum]
MRVCVIGAGVIGTTTAYFLAREGHEVVLVDSQPGPGEVSSYANGGQLSYSYVAPLAGPGVLPSVPGWLLRADSPLRFRPRMDPHQWLWCLQFALACRADVARRSTAQLQTLSYLSRDVLNALLEETPLEFGHLRNGKLIAYRSAELLDKARRLAAYQASLGAAEQRVLGAAETLALEPALAGMGSALAGAVYTPSEEAGDCHQFTVALFERLKSLGNVECHMGCRVTGLWREGRRVVAVRTAQGDIGADAVVLATGVGTRELIRPLGQDVPLYPLKGYSLTVPLRAEDESVAPAISVTDYERRIVYARIGQTLRIAAMVDIGSPGASIDDKRVALLKQQVAEAFPGLDLSRAQAWAGLRPATPTGKPLIGRARVADNLWLNIGQGALGFTLACGSATLLSALMQGITPPIDAQPFQP